MSFLWLACDHSSNQKRYTYANTFKSPATMSSLWSAPQLVPEIAVSENVCQDLSYEWYPTPSSMILPGWNSLDSVTRIGNAVKIGTLCCWGCLVLFEAVAYFWKKCETFFTVLALLAFGLALIGEVGNYEYDGRNEQLHEDLEKALKQRTADLEASVADRHLTLDQRKQMVAILRGLPGTRVMVTYLLNADTDAQEYATEIGSVFRDIPGWTLVAPPPGVSSDEPVYGFAIQAHNDSTSKVQGIENTVAVTGYKVTRWPMKQGPEEIDIYVGRKDLPKQYRDISNQ